MPCWGCAGDGGSGACRAGQPVLQSLSPINITSENEVIVAGQTVWENTFTAPGGFPLSSFQLFLCAASLRSPSPSVSSGLLCTWAEAVCWVLLTRPFGSNHRLQEQLRCWGRPWSLQWVLLCLCCHVKEVAAELLPAASGQPQQARPPRDWWGVTGPVALSSSSSWSHM